MTNQNLLDQKVILVTGSSNGIGRLTVATLARQRHTVYASMRDANGRMQPLVLSCSNLPMRRTLTSTSSNLM